jgi:hypothetical protein
MKIADQEFEHLLSPLTLAVHATSDMMEPYRYADHLEYIDAELVKLYNREDGYPRRLMVDAPPRHGKSELCSKWFPTWGFAIDPALQLVLTSYELEQASRWGRKARGALQELRPMLGTRILEDSRAAHRWETSLGGQMVSAGVRGPITGKGASILICDDPIKNAEEANSATIRDAIWNWWTTTFLTREQKNRHGDEPVIVLIMTRWHEDDLAGRILNSSEAKLWRYVHLPAFAEQDDQLGRVQGRALWPEMFNELTLEQKRAEMGGYAFQALYQGNPQPPGGLSIQKSWWRYYTEQPKPEEIDQWVLSVDPTFKGNADSDYVAMGVLGRKGTDFFLMDAVHKQMNGPDTIKAITGPDGIDALWPLCKWLLIEDTASGSMICDILERDRGHVIRGKHRSQQKTTRLSWQVNGAAALIERGSVWLPADTPTAASARCRAAARKLVDEGAAFPHGKHDDLLDMLVQGLERLLPRAWAHESRMKRDALNKPPENYVEQMTQDLWRKIHARVEREQKNRTGASSTHYWTP